MSQKWNPANYYRSLCHLLAIYPNYMLLGAVEPRPLLLTYCTGTGWCMMKSVEQSVECHFVHHKSPELQHGHMQRAHSPPSGVFRESSHEYSSESLVATGIKLLNSQQFVSVPPQVHNRWIHPNYFFLPQTDSGSETGALHFGCADFHRQLRL
jgi:hypothetical protein